MKIPFTFNASSLNILAKEGLEDKGKSEEGRKEEGIWEEGAGSNRIWLNQNIEHLS